MKTTNIFSMVGAGYAAPAVERIDFAVEQGFAVSAETDEATGLLPGLGYNDDYEGDEY